MPCPAVGGVGRESVPSLGCSWCQSGLWAPVGSAPSPAMRWGLGERYVTGTWLQWSLSIGGDGGGAGIGSSALLVSMLTRVGGANILEVPTGS